MHYAWHSWSLYCDPRDYPDNLDQHNYHNAYADLEHDPQEGGGREGRTRARGKGVKTPKSPESS